MKKLYLMVSLIFLILVGCSNESEQGANDKVKVGETTSDSAGEKAEPAEQEDLPERSFFTFEEFNQMFEEDPNEKHWIDGKFELADGSIVYADYFKYGKSDLFDYATAIFYGGKLAYIKLETQSTPEEFLSALKIAQGQNTSIEPNPKGFEITFDDKFLEKNIHTYPDEWE